MSVVLFLLFGIMLFVMKNGWYVSLKLCDELFENDIDSVELIVVVVIVVVLLSVGVVIVENVVDV